MENENETLLRYRISRSHCQQVRLPIMGLFRSDIKNTLSAHSCGFWLVCIPVVKRCSHSELTPTPSNGVGVFSVLIMKDEILSSSGKETMLPFFQRSIVSRKDEIFHRSLGIQSEALKFLNKLEAAVNLYAQCLWRCRQFAVLFFVCLFTSPCNLTCGRPLRSGITRRRVIQNSPIVGPFTEYIFSSGRFRSKKLRERQHFCGSGCVEPQLHYDTPKGLVRKGRHNGLKIAGDCPAGNGT